MRKSRYSILVLVILFTVGCKSSREIAPTSTPTFVAGDDFDCWTQSVPNLPANKNHGEEWLLVVFDDNSNESIYRYDSEVKDYVLLVSGISGYPPKELSPVSPIGQHFWYQVTNESRRSADNFIMSLSDNATTYEIPFLPELGASIEPVSWSASGQCLFVPIKDSVLAFRISDGVLQQKTFPNQYFYQISVSPGDSVWAFGCEEYGICVMNVEGILQSHFAARGGHTHGIPRWSPDGSLIAFTHGDSEMRPGYANVVKIIEYPTGTSMSQGGIRPGSPLDNLQWSPDGKHLLIDTSDPEELSIYDVDANVVTAITTPPRNISPVWARDSKHVIFIGDDHHSLYQINTDTMDLESLPIPDVDIGFIIVSVFRIP